MPNPTPLSGASHPSRHFRIGNWPDPMGRVISNWPDPMRARIGSWPSPIARRNFTSGS